MELNRELRYKVVSDDPSEIETPLGEMRKINGTIRHV